MVSPTGVYLVEIKSYPGRIEGDAGTWRWIEPDQGRTKWFDNPLKLANRKAKKLASLLRRQRAARGPGRVLPAAGDLPVPSDAPGGHSSHDGVLVDIHPDVNLGRRCGHGSVLLAGATSIVACGYGIPTITGVNRRYARRAGPSISSAGSANSDSLSSMALRSRKAMVS